jgi:hypothetical protein
LLKWPDFPKVEVVDKKIVIFYENGSQMVWGIEEETDQFKVVNDIKVGLRAIDFLQCSMDNVIDACLMILSDIGVPEELGNEYLNVAFQGLMSKRSKSETLETEKKPTLFYLR